MFYIYQIFNLKNGKIYIGQSNDIRRRWHEHIATSFNEKKKKSQKLIHKAIKKYGTNNFQFTIIQTVCSFKEAIAAEQYWISFFKSNVIRYGDQFGYNLSDGGDGPTGPKSESHKKNIGASLRGKAKSKEAKLSISKSKSILTDKELEIIKNLLKNNVSQYTIANIVGISQGEISQIKIGNSHKYYFSDEDLKIFSQRLRPTFGEKNGGAKLTEIKVKEIKLLLLKGEPATKIAKLYGVGQSQILRIKNGESWKHII